jgi:hypothetical protein
MLISFLLAVEVEAVMVAIILLEVEEAELVEIFIKPPK